MSVQNFIPTVWAGNILRALDTALVYPQLMNRDYEGDIETAGDTVKINMIGDVAVFTYSKNQDMSSPESLTDAQLTLRVDQSKAFNFAVDDVDAVQTKPKVMDEAARRAAYGLRKVTDSFCAGLYTDIASGNFIGSDASPITGTWTTAGTLFYDRLVDLGALLDTNDIPDDGRFVVIPPWAEGYLLKDSRFVGFGTAENIALLFGGFPGEQQTQPNNGVGPGARPIGRAAGFDLYKSNQVPNTSATKYKIIAGHPMAWAFADQILSVEAYRVEKRFADGLKGLHVYGGKVVRPNALALLTANPT